MQSGLSQSFVRPQYELINNIGSSEMLRSLSFHGPHHHPRKEIGGSEESECLEPSGIMGNVSRRMAFCHPPTVTATRKTVESFQARYA